jgi:hypothetical protein
MGWYHHEIASERDPFEDEKKATGSSSCQQQEPQQNVSTTCVDGSCSKASTATTSLSSSKQQQHPPAQQQQQEQVEEELYIDDGPIYHLCDKANWLLAIRQGQSYYPPTFWLDGRFTRTCCKKDMMVQTGNEYYKNHTGDWILLVLNPSMIRNFGIPIACHFAPESTVSTPVECLKVYSGISVTTPGLVSDVYLMQRSANGTFIGMTQDNNNTVPRCVKKNQQQSIDVSKKESPLTTDIVDNKENNKTEKKRTGLLWMRKK